ncbi:MAG: hypothetical protein ACKO86_19245, partial [Dolichospermum sp.]
GTGNREQGTGNTGRKRELIPTESCMATPSYQKLNIIAIFYICTPTSRDHRENEKLFQKRDLPGEFFHKNIL